MRITRRTLVQSTLVTAGAAALAPRGVLAAQQPAKAPFRYVQAKAFHIPPETTTEESGYFSLCEGRNGKIYVGTAAYGRNSFLVEFDPATEKMRIVLDTHKVVGQKTTGYAAQAKLHTRNVVGPSGKIYVGSKQGYLSQAEQAARKRGQKVPVYEGGYVLVYDPAKDTTENLGMPMPLDKKLRAAGRTEGEGVIDVTADERRGLIYVVTCEHQHWMLYDLRTSRYRELGPILRDQPNTIIDALGRGTAITADYRVARYDPAKDRVSIDPLLVAGKPFAEFLGAKRVHPDWRITPDGQTAYQGAASQEPGRLVAAAARLSHAAGWHADAAARHHEPDRGTQRHHLRDDNLSIHPVEGRNGKGSTMNSPRRRVKCIAMPFHFIEVARTIWLTTQGRR